jgi:RNA polymerase sigma-70 factor (ECF subfamily)
MRPSSHPSEWVADARARWPLLRFGEAEFRAHLERLGRARPAFPADTYLAAACVGGDEAAIRVLEEELISRVPQMIRRVDATEAFASEICQRLRLRLLVSDDGAPPRIARYTGEVPLVAWIRVIAVRLALNEKRGKTIVGGRAAEEVVLDDPEVDYLRAQYRAPFVRAFKSAFEALTKDDRTILYLHDVDGASIDAIGRIYKVHRATVARWLVRIRRDVLSRAKELLAEQLGAEIDEAGSVIAALAGELGVTLSHVLGVAEPSSTRR